MTNNENNKYKEGVSVVIVTYNGSSRLLPTLTHLAKQKEINFNFEILLIDNNSNDGTSKKVIEIWNNLGDPFPFRVLLEPTPGTMYARKKGIEESAYRYMLYCDDDNWLCSNYVSTAHQLIKNQPEIGVIGGRGILVYDKGFIPPKWIAAYERNYGTEQADEDGDVTESKGCLFTAGALLDREWLNTLYEIGFQSALKGRDGKSLVAGEDTELTYALKIIGAKLFYSSKMTFKHYMPPERIQWSYLKRLWFAYGVGDYILLPYTNYFAQRKKSSFLKMLLLNLKSTFALRLKLTLKKTFEGDRRQLLLAMRKGELKSMIQNKKKNEKTKEILSILRKNQKS